MTIEKAIKLIMANEFESEMKRPRSKEMQNELGAALQTIEIETQKKISRLENGEDIFSILPELKNLYDN